MPHPYNTTYTRPFPTLPLVIKSKACADAGSDGAATKSLPALVDTGADASLVPIALLQTIEADRADLARLRSHWGEWRSVVTYLVAPTTALYCSEILKEEDVAKDNVSLARNVALGYYFRLV